MADRNDFYFRQRVTEAELDLAFELLEKTDRHLAADIGGIVWADLRAKSPKIVGKRVRLLV